MLTEIYLCPTCSCQEMLRVETTAYHLWPARGGGQGRR
jgi:hypothetical protein